MGTISSQVIVLRQSEVIREDYKVEYWLSVITRVSKVITISLEEISLLAWRMYGWKLCILWICLRMDEEVAGSKRWSWTFHETSFIGVIRRYIEFPTSSGWHHLLNMIENIGLTIEENKRMYPGIEFIPQEGSMFIIVQVRMGDPNGNKLRS